MSVQTQTSNCEARECHYAKMYESEQDHTVSLVHALVGVLDILSGQCEAQIDSRDWAGVYGCDSKYFDDNYYDSDERDIIRDAARFIKEVCCDGEHDSLQEALKHTLKYINQEGA